MGPKYELGELVIPVAQDPYDCHYNPLSNRMDFSYNQSMNAYAGKPYKVINIERCRYGFIYFLDKPAHDWNWLEQWLLPANVMDNQMAAQFLKQKE